MVKNRDICRGVRPFFSSEDKNGKAPIAEVVTFPSQRYTYPTETNPSPLAPTLLPIQATTPTTNYAGIATSSRNTASFPKEKHMLRDIPPSVHGRL